MCVIYNTCIVLPCPGIHIRTSLSWCPLTLKWETELQDDLHPNTQQMKVVQYESNLLYTVYWLDQGSAAFMHWWEQYLLCTCTRVPIQSFLCLYSILMNA